MRGVSSIIAAALLFGIASWTFSEKGVTIAVLVMGAISFVLFARGVQGRGLEPAAADAVGAVDFIRNPGEAIVDAATEQVGQWLTDTVKKPAEDKPDFDPDAAIARYLANRPEPLPSGADPAPAPRTFGRKGL